MADKVKLIPLAPYDGQTGLLIPFVLERVRKAAQEWNFEMDPDQAVANIGARVYSGDPTIALLAFMDEKGKVVGHAVASIEGDGTNTWVFVSQVKMDPGDWGDAVLRAMTEADKWAQWYSETWLVPRGRKPITYMLMATHREDRGFQKKFNFASHRHVMLREVGSAKTERASAAPLEKS